MVLFSPAAILVGLLLLYIFSFLIFAIVRIATGVSIQRIGYFSLRRIAYTPREGVLIELRGLGLSLHTPSFAQPTWISLRLTEPKITIDPAALTKDTAVKGRGRISKLAPGSYQKRDERDTRQLRSHLRSKVWQVLTSFMKYVKFFHHQIKWLALVDVVATNATIRLSDAGQFHFGSLSFAVDTRRKMVKRGKTFGRKEDKFRDNRPVEWMVNIRNILLAVDGCEPMELLDNVGISVYGLVYKGLEGLADVAIAIKVGRMHVPYDDLRLLLYRIKKFRKSSKESMSSGADDEVSFTTFVEELEKPGSRDDTLAHIVADSKECANSLLQGIQEVQLALNFFKLSGMIHSLSSSGNDVYLNVVSHEVGVDLHRMDQGSPAHRMYFRGDDIAHQALFAAISLSASLDDSSGETDNVLYIPMATTTIKTTLPSKAVSAVYDYNVDERNTNVLFANLVMTSPSLDLEPKHMSRLLGLIQAQTSPRARRGSRHLISRLLPKANIKLSVHEPVMRLILPISSSHDAAENDYNLLISSISSISLDIESSHSSEGEVHYSLSSVLRVTSPKLYYQTPSGVKHNLLTTESLEFRAVLNALPEVYVIASGAVNACSAHMVNGDVNRGIRQVAEQFLAQIQSKHRVSTPLEKHKPSPLRYIPHWLLRFQFEATNFSLEIAGVDRSVSELSRGVSLQLQSWTADYRSQKSEPTTKMAKRRTPSHSTVGNESFQFPPTSPPKKAQRGATDGRRLALHVRRFEGFVIESDDYLEPEAFFSLPRFEIALSASSNRHGPFCHVNSVIKGVYLKYSLYRYYCLGVATAVVQDVFMRPRSLSETSSQMPTVMHAKDYVESRSPSLSSSASKAEFIAVDIRITMIQAKVFLPADPPLMLQFYGVTAGFHRLSAPFMKANLVRLHAEAPNLKGVWARIVSMSNARLDLCKTMLKHGHDSVEERSFDLWADFVRLGVPHHMVMHRIFDNLINTTKILKQLHRRLQYPSGGFISERGPEGPKKVPKISLRSKAVLFELEDDAFEWKLGCIYRTGLLEQRQRLAREEAFKLKLQKVKQSGQRRTSSKLQAATNHRALLNSRTSNDTKRSKSAGEPSGDDVSEPAHGMERKLRYDADGACRFSAYSKISPDSAWYKLQEHNARAWKDKIDAAMQFQGASMKEVRDLFSGADEPPGDMCETETILSIPNRPGLMSAMINDVNFVIDKPFFPQGDYATYIHRIGKGMPMSTKYGLLIPMSIQLDMGEARVSLRDYPLDLLHIPPLRPGQSPRLPSWSLRTNFVIAEEYRDHKSARQVKLDLVPSSPLPDGTMSPPFQIDVWRSVSPVKTYSDPIFEINTSLPTGISWGMSYQPVIQDMMKIIEGFTKTEIDPSERVGFWDKIRLSFHSRIRVIWKGDGDVHLRLKGSRDPYVITGFGAGFVMCWRRDVKLDINTSDNPMEFMSVTSGEYVLAIPDYSNEARCANEASVLDMEGSSTSSDSKNAAHFKKVVMKLSGDVRWVVGLVFERSLPMGERSFQFKPHYDVVLQNPRLIDAVLQQNYDAYRGFRSNHIHLSIAVIAPEGRNWAADSIQPSASYNTVHLTPRTFTHFFNWWSLFSGVMSLPVRQGRLWPGVTKTSKKFNRHLATVKYKLLLAPLFVAHIYKHKDREDYAEDVVTATGLKVRIDSLKLDVHQRREQIKTRARGRARQVKVSTMRINRTQLDLQAADFRAVSASIEGTNTNDVERSADDIISSFQQPVASVDLSRFTIPDENLDWIDMDDFVELDWILPQESNPRTQILPLAFTPRSTYFRRTDHGQVGPGETGFSLFGDEPTHECVMSESNEPSRVQMELIRDRLSTIEAQIYHYDGTIGKQETRMTENVDHGADSRDEHNLFARYVESLAQRRNFLIGEVHRLEVQLDQHGQRSPNGGASGTAQIGTDSGSVSGGKEADIDELYTSPTGRLASDFDNRFVIHNVQLKWNNSLRDIILRYSHQVSQRRGFMYYMSRRAIKFILDIVNEQAKSKQRHPKIFKSSPERSSEGDDSVDNDDCGSVEDRIEQLLSDMNRYVNADERDASDSTSQDGSKPGDSCEQISPEFTPKNSYYLRLIAPQIQLQSEKNRKSVVLVAAKGMQLKVISIMDKERMSDDINGLVQQRFSLEMDGAQFFVATKKRLIAHLQFYAGNKYGNSPESAWPPWLTMEAMFDFELSPFGFSRIVQKTSASLRYDKYNNLRLKYNADIARSAGCQNHCTESHEARMDQISADFPHVRAICDSAEYYSMYIIVLDLLLYSEPLEKVRNERLEKIMLTSDFSDLRGAPEKVFKLQSRIRQLTEIKEHFQIHAKYSDKQSWQDRLALDEHLTQSEDELFFLMKAITTSQRKAEPTKAGANGLLRWNLSASEVVWHLMKEQTEPLVEFQLRNANYERTDNSDGSNHNLVWVERLDGLNLLRDAVYPQIIVPYTDGARKLGQPNGYMLKVKWHMLEAVGGIPVLDDFEVSLFPLKIQLERELGQKLFEYIFPSIGPGGPEDGTESPTRPTEKMEPLGDGSVRDDVDVASQAFSVYENISADRDSQNGPRAAGSVELRLRPTLSLSKGGKPQAQPKGFKGLGMTAIYRETSRQASRSTSGAALSKKRSMDNFRMLVRQPTDKMSAVYSASFAGEEKSKRSIIPKGWYKDGQGNGSPDDLSEMMFRASNYMTLAHVKVHDVVLCLSYKGKGDYNIEDLHDFVFRLPILEYRNKTWSNLDLALRLKRDVIKALISHTPAILGNKFSHRPTKEQQRKYREIASSSQILPSTHIAAGSSYSARSQSVTGSFGSNSLYLEPLAPESLQTDGPPLIQSDSQLSSVNSSTGQSISDCHSADEADVDARWERSRRHANLPIRPVTSGRVATVSVASNLSEQEEGRRKAIRGIRMKLRRVRRQA